MSTSFETTSRHLLISIIDELVKSGNKITVIKKTFEGSTEEIPAELSDRGIEVISILCASPKKSNFLARYLNDVKYINKCKKQLKSDYDAVFIQSSNVAGLVMKIVCKRYPNAIKTFNVQDVFPQNACFSGLLSERRLPYKVLLKIQKFAYSYSDHIIAISEDIKQLLVEDCGVDSSKISIVYNWSYKDTVYDETSFNYAELSKIYKEDCFNVLYAGNIGVMQNVDVILESAKQLRDEKKIWFYIIGNGVYQNKLKNMADSYGITNISFLPMFPAKLAPSIYGLADLNVIPLKKNVFRTAVPSKTATCLACGKPIVFAIGKSSEFGKRVSDATGCFLIDSDDANALSEIILRVKNEGVKVNTAEFYSEHMNKTMNSRKYAEIITKGHE